MSTLESVRLAHDAAGLNSSSRALIKGERELHHHASCMTPKHMNAGTFLHTSQLMQSSAAGSSRIMEAKPPCMTWHPTLVAAAAHSYIFRTPSAHHAQTFSANYEPTSTAMSVSLPLG